jgi:tetratricopeptide (TPR) repeat protein
MSRLPNDRRWNSWSALIVALWLATCGLSADDIRDPLARRCEYGVTLALRGHWARAETVFVSLLSRSPSDSRALTNLGNLYLLRGNMEKALAFYEQAARADTTDGGIRLDRAVALELMGDPEHANLEAIEGTRLAGGERAAAALLGIRLDGEPVDETKGAEGTRMTREKIRVLLAKAAGAVPKDTGGVAPGPATPPGERKRRAPTIRPAGPRSAGETEATTILYWKR